MLGDWRGNMDEIEPCPWCASRAETRERSAAFDEDEQDADPGASTDWRAYCVMNLSCCASGPYCATEEEAIAAWNRVARPAKEKTT